jgi:hypothetical protein
MGAEIGGRPGSWDKGLKAVERYLGGIGIKAGSYQMQNGSGLYDSNRFSAEQIVTILRAASRDFRISAEFLASLAVAGTGRNHRAPHGRDARGTLRAREDRHAGKRQLSVGFRRLTGSHTPRVLDHRERYRERERCAPHAGPRGGDPGRLFGGRRRDQAVSLARSRRASAR